MSESKRPPPEPSRMTTPGYGFAEATSRPGERAADHGTHLLGLHHAAGWTAARPWPSGRMVSSNMITPLSILERIVLDDGSKSLHDVLSLHAGRLREFAQQALVLEIAAL